jgi:DNA primase
MFLKGDTMKRFTRSELFALRNHIPISVLIEDLLKIPCKMSEGQFRFLCPTCGEFQTATNPKTNLARCFLCGKNFNTIDMVMTCENSSFVETVNALKAYRKQFKPVAH